MQKDSLQWLERFLEMLVSERGVSRQTFQAYEKDILTWIAFLKDTPLSLVMASHRDTYIAFLQEKGLGMRSVARYLSSLRQFISFLLTENALSKDPFQGLKSVRYHTALPRVLSPEDIKKMLNYVACDLSPEGRRLWLLLEMFYATGMRVSELVTLHTHQFSQEDHICIQGKGGHERFVFFTPQARKALIEYLRVRAHFLPPQSISFKFLFPSRGKHGHLTRQRVGQLLKHLAEACGLPLESLFPHALRHAFATHLLQAGVDLVILKQLLGHRDISSTQIYTHVNSKHWARLLAKHHPLKDFCLSSPQN